MTELPFDYPAALPNPAAVPRKCRRHDWWMPPVVGPDAPRYNFGADGPLCRRCGQLRNDVHSRRGKLNRSRGNAIERAIGHQLGLRRVGMYGGPEDLSGDLFCVQVKSGGAFPERLWRWLKAVPVNAGQTPLVVITDAPGPGKRRRALVVLEIDEWINLHGPTP